MSKILHRWLSHESQYGTDANQLTSLTVVWCAAMGEAEYEHFDSSEFAFRILVPENECRVAECTLMFGS